MTETIILPESPRDFEVRGYGSCEFCLKAITGGRSAYEV